MPYADITALTAAGGGTDRFRQLADWDSDGTPDADVIAQAQAASDAVIHSYAGRRFDAAATDPMLTRVAAQEAIYWMRDARGVRSPEDDRTHEENIAWLKDLAIGKVRLADPQPAKSGAIKSAWVTPSTNAAVSRDNLKGFA